MHWLVFGDDWGRHPSTTQHLVRHLPASETITWVDSLAMRPPRLSLSDLRRVLQRLAPTPATRSPLAAHLRPRVLPFHVHPAARALNARILARLLPRTPDVALITNPVAALYLDVIAPERVVYLRLDDWPSFPGVDQRFVAATDPQLLRTADLVVAPSASLMIDATVPTLLLPQGVDLALFSVVPLEPPRTKTLGYWGGLSAWLDQDLIVAVARRHPDWTLELIGRVDTDLARLRHEPNIHLRGPVAHADLPGLTAHWRAAWMPYVVGPATAGMSPLKLREYLAAGFPTASTALPEAASLPITIVSDLDAIDAWLATPDTFTARAARRASVQGDSWHARATTLMRAVVSLRARQ